MRRVRFGPDKAAPSQSQRVERYRMISISPGGCLPDNPAARMANEPGNVHVLEHALGAVRLATLRSAATGVPEFRRALQDLAVLLFAEASRRFPLTATEVATPLESCAGARFARPVILVPILRAGLGMLDSVTRLLPEARIGHLGLYRDEKTLRPVTYFTRVPSGLADAEVVLLDPMLATGFSACAAATYLKGQGAKNLHFICAVACPAGLRQLHADHPEIPVTTAAVDRELNSSGYILPGLGDAGDRYFGTME